MIINKLPIRNIVCECGCDFDIEIHDIKSEILCGDDKEMVTTYVLCPFCNAIHQLTDWHIKRIINV